MDKFPNLPIDIRMPNFSFRLGFSRSLALAGFAYFSYSVYQSTEFYEEQIKKLQLANKDFYLARFQTYFIEAFNSSFTLGTNFDEGFLKRIRSSSQVPISRGQEKGGSAETESRLSNEGLFVHECNGNGLLHARVLRLFSVGLRICVFQQSLHPKYQNRTRRFGFENSRFQL